jgi:primosomal protein N' (replication factor Y)
MMYAKVIVDVPSRQTNRPFDYKVPDQLNGVVEIGSRVLVPFGPRTVQGFVVELHPETEVNPDKLKSVERVLDLDPPLTKELVELAGWMSRQYACHEMTAMLAMLPGALKTKVERYVSAADRLEASAAEANGGGRSDSAGAMNRLPVMTEEERNIWEYVRGKQQVAMDHLLDLFAGREKQIKAMIAEGMLRETRTVRDRAAVKKVWTVFPPDDIAQLSQALAQLNPNARKQRETLQYLLDHPEPVKLSELLQALGADRSSVQRLADKGWIRLEQQEEYRDPYAGRRFEPTQPMPLTEEQRSAYEPIVRALHGRRTESFLLHGVTGSGKTEVYLQAIEQTLLLGREAIVLVPEISLTPQMVARFKGRFGDRVAVLHSRLSHGERYDEWRKIQRREVSVVIGARSAVFAPFTRIGLIIIDEEHESSYKQEDSPKYHARDVALERARKHQAVVVLGSATPSLETYQRTLTHAASAETAAASTSCAGESKEIAGGSGKSLQTGPVTGFASPMRRLTMRARVGGRPLPQVQIVDMREELKSGNRSMFSRRLHQAIEERLSRNEQIVLLMNRRGFSTFVMCRSCGYVAECPHCEISLTYHRKSLALRCHYCGYAEREPKACPDCGSPYIRHFGAGTQRVEEELGRLFPGIRVIRMDVDTTGEKGAHEKWLTLFANRQADVLLGTQMVAKGLDFPHVTLVGVISADTVLHVPDFRSAEKTFQLLTQVAGRAGRHTLPGDVVIQTYAPDHYSIQCAGSHDYEAFVAKELELRRLRMYPPFCRLVLVTLSHEQVPLLVRAGEQFAFTLKEQASRAGLRAAAGDGPFMEVLGPVASPVPKLKDRYRFQCMVKYRGDIDAAGIVKNAAAVLDDAVQKEGLTVSIDVDPQMLM